MAQIGTIGVETQNNGTVKVPVFDTADAGSDVHTMWRVQTASGVGFVPLVATGDASFPYIRVQSQNHGVVAVHKDPSLLEQFYTKDGYNLDLRKEDDSLVWQQELNNGAGAYMNDDVIVTPGDPDDTDDGDHEVFSFDYDGNKVHSQDLYYVIDGTDEYSKIDTAYPMPNSNSDVLVTAEVDNAIARVDISDGTKQWQSGFDYNSRLYNVALSPNANYFYVASSDGYLDVAQINVSDGTVEWKILSDSVGGSDPDVTFGTHVVVVEGGDIIYYNQDVIKRVTPNNTEVWSNNLSFTPASANRSHSKSYGPNDNLYISEEGNGVHKIDTSDGSVIWTANLQHQYSFSGPPLHAKSDGVGVWAGERGLYDIDGSGTILSSNNTPHYGKNLFNKRPRYPIFPSQWDTA